jgi:glutamate N-acetyltransferase/amino-acid N-acetyltransferase
MAVGKVFDATIDPPKTHAMIIGYEVVRDGARVEFDDPTVRNALKADIVDIAVSLGVGNASATAYGCDLTQGYIDENAAYYSS